jgi:hypothetical protein
MTIEEALKVIQDIYDEEHPAFGNSRDRHEALEMAMDALRAQAA